MKRFSIFLILNFWAVTAALAQSPAMPVMTAKSWLLLDATTEQVIASHQPGLRVEPASLTKLMTGYIACAAVEQKKIQRDQMVDVSARAWKTDRGGSRMFIEPGKPVSIGDLLHGLIVQSGNDAAVALAEAISGSEPAFVAEMNRMAKVMGLKDTQFANSHGLPDPNNYSTARDLAILATHVIYDYPECYSIYAVKTFTYNGIAQPNRNRLLAPDQGIDGMKTGQTAASGYSLIASASRQLGTGAVAVNRSRRLVAVVLGAASGNARTFETQRLLNWGFRNFHTIKLYAAGDVVATPIIWKGLQKEIKAGFTEDVIITVPRAAARKVKSHLEIKEPLLAPAAEGTQLGQLRVTLDDAVLVTRPIVALENVGQADFFTRMLDVIWLWMR
ncbi:MAG: D-alanyl-D-alanine carboxypeptidase [Herminiimonas sp.]|nr:D-alanyl-D-alanine carboxypeptidase [Herminiimonas sp.]